MAKVVMQHTVDKIPSEILAGIGEIVAEWSYLHFQLGVIIREVCNLPKDAGRVLTVGAEIGVTCGILLTMTQDDTFIKDKGIREDLDALARQVREKSGNRNAYAHGIFRADGDKVVRILMHSPANRITPAEEKITVPGLKRIAREAHQFWERAQDVTVRVKAWKKKRK